MFMKIPSIFKNKEANKQQTWPWPSCNHPKTLSFRETKPDRNKNVIFKTVNSVFLDPNSQRADLYSAKEQHSEPENNNRNYEGEPSDHSIEIMIRDVRSSDRLFFEPNDTGGSSLMKEDEEVSLPFKESVALALESDDPYLDFKRSMQAMVETHGLKDWACLEELLGWYLKMNGKTNHGIIFGAFVDVLIESIASSSSPTDSSTATVCCSDSSSSYSSANSCFSSPCSHVSSSPRL